MKPLRLLTGAAATAGIVLAASCMRDRLVSPDTPLPAVLAVDRPAVQMFRFARGRMVAADTVRISNNGAGNLGPVERLGGVDYQEGRTGWLDARVVNLDANNALLVLVPSYAEDEQQQGDRAEVILRGAGASELKRVTVSARTLPGAKFEFSVSPAAFTAAPGDPPPPAQTLVVRNGGNGTLRVHPPTIEYEGTAAGWLSVVRAGGSETSPSFSVQANPGTLAGGLYQARLSFASPAGEETRAVPAFVPVLLNVGTPRLGISSARVAFNLVYGEAPPPTQAVLLSNAGAGSFAALGQVRVDSVRYLGTVTGWLQAGIEDARALLTANTTALRPGSYTANVWLGSAAGGAQALQAKLTVDSALLSLSSQAVSFGMIRGDSLPRAQTVRAANTGAGTFASLGELRVTGFVPAVDWVSATISGSDVSIAPTAAATALAVGNHTTKLVIASAWGGSDTLAVTMAVSRGVDAPDLALSTSQLSFSLVRGDAPPGAQTVRASNAGGGTLGAVSLGAISYAGQSGWLQLSIRDTTVTALVDSAGLPDGRYEASFRIISQNGGQLPVTVVLTVASPVLTLSATSVSFSSEVGGTAGAIRTVTLSNTGPGKGLETLGALSAGPVSYGSGSGWLSSSLSGATLTLTLSSVPATAGSYTATVPVVSRNGGTASVQVALTVAPPPTPPDLVVSPATVRIYALEGGANPPVERVLTSNGGGGSLGTIGASVSGAGWLSAAVDGAAVTLTASTGSLAAGTYNGTVTVTSASGGNETVAVVLEVKAPRLTLSTRSASFQAVQGSAVTPSVIAITASNTGGGEFSALGGVSLGTTSYTGTGGWLSAVPAGESVFNLSASATGLAVGTYTAQVPVNSVRGGSETVTVVLTVAPVPAAPDLVVSPQSLRFTAVTGGSNPPGQTVVASNGGGGGISALGTLSTGTITYGPGATGWLAKSLSGTDIDLTVTTGSRAAGSYTASFTVSATAGGPAETVNVQFDVYDAAAPADLELGAATVEFTALVGGSSPAQREVPVYNGGADRLGTITLGTITYGAGASGWLSGSSVSNSALTLKPALGSIGGGTYTASVVVNSQDGGADTVQVTLRVGQPQLSLSTTAPRFSAVAGGSSPAAQALVIGNSGAGTVAQLGTITLGSISYGAGASGWLAASVGTGLVNLSATLDTLAAGSYTASFDVNAANGGSQTVSVQFDVAAAGATAVLGLAATQVEFVALVGGGNPAERTLAILNRGTGDLGAITVGTISYGAGASGWLSASATSSLLTLAPTVGSLGAGSYDATVPVNSANGGGASVTVRLVVRAPDLALSALSAAFAGTTRGADPDDQVILLSNSGSGVFADLGTLTLGTLTYGGGATGWLERTLSGSDLQLSVTPGSLSPATYTASFAVNSTNGGAETVSVSFTVVAEAAPPVLALGASQVDFSAVVGAASPDARTVTVQNAGTGNLGTISTGAIVYETGTSGWLSVSASNTAITLTPSTSALAAGSYRASVPVNSVNGGSAQLVVTLTVGLPQLTLSSRAVSFAAVRGGSSPAAQTVQVSNTGAGTYQQLGVQAATPVSYASGSGWLTASLNTGTGVLTLQAALGTLAAGTYQATVTVSSSAGGSQTVGVSFTVAESAEPPALALGASSVKFVAVRGAPAPPPVQVLISNSGGGGQAALGTLSVATPIVYGSGSGWLGTPQIAGSALTLAPASAGLAAGVYTATVTVRSQNGGNQAVAVTLEVVQPVLTASSLALSFTALAGGGSPGAQSLTLSNTGGGTFSDLGALSVQSVNYSAGATGWLTSPRAGAGLSGATVTFEASPTGLAPGSYGASVVLSSLYGGSQSVTVTLSLARESDPARLVLSVTTQSFSALVGGADPEPETVTVSNAGGGSLGTVQLGQVGYQAGASGWLSASLSGSTIRLQATSVGLAKNDYVATLPVSSTGGGSAELTVRLRVGSPDLTLKPRILSFWDSTGGAGPAPQEVSAANTGGGTMASLGALTVQAPVYEAGVPPWLQIDTLGTSFRFTADTRAVNPRPAAYTAAVLIGSTYGGSDTVTVSFTVPPAGLPPKLELPGTRSFAGIIGQPNPEPQDVPVVNAGGGRLGPLTVSSAAAWLKVQVDTPSARLILTPDARGLVAALYRTTLAVSADPGGSDELEVTMELGQPVLALSTRTITFSDTVSSRDTLRSQVFISNSGAGTQAALDTIRLGTVSYVSGGTGWLRTLPASGQTVEAFLATVEAVAADLPEGTSIARVPFHSRWGGSDTLTVTFTTRRPDRSFDLPTIELVRTVVVNGVPQVQKLPGDSVVVTAQARSAAQVGLRLGIRNAADTRLTLSGLRVGLPTYTVGKSGWISGAFLDRTSATLSDPAELFVAIEPAALDAGRYEAQLVVRSEAVGLAEVAPVTLRIILQVQ